MKKKKKRSTCCGERRGHCRNEFKLRSAEDTAVSCCAATQASSLKLTDDKNATSLRHWRGKRRGESYDSDSLSGEVKLFVPTQSRCLWSAARCKSSVDFLRLFFFKGRVLEVEVWNRLCRRREGSLQVSLVQKHRPAVVTASLGERRELVRFAWPPTNATKRSQVVNAKTRRSLSAISVVSTMMPFLRLNGTPGSPQSVTGCSASSTDVPRRPITALHVGDLETFSPNHVRRKTGLRHVTCKNKYMTVRLMPTILASFNDSNLLKMWLQKRQVWNWVVYLIFIVSMWFNMEYFR